MSNEKEKRPLWLTIATVKDGMLNTYGRYYYEDMLRKEQSEWLDREFGPGNWTMLPTDNLPEGFGPATYTVENGQLVPASAEVLEARREAENARETEAVRSAREARYRTETDQMLFDAMERYAKAHPEELAFADWLAAKNLIREELPKA